MNDYQIIKASLAERLESTISLWRDHWHEQGEEAARKLMFNPDIEGFLDAERRGYFGYLAVLHVDELVGHFGLSFFKNRQTSLWVAGDDFLYLKPEHRKGFLALKLIRAAVDLAFSNQAVEFGISFRTFGSVDLEPLLRRCKFKHLANVYSVRR